MDDSDIVVIDSPDQIPSASQNEFSIASPAVCQRWTRPASVQPERQIASQSPWTNTYFSPPVNFHPQPIITNVTSLSPKRNPVVTITEVKSFPRKKYATLKPIKTSTRRNLSSDGTCQPIITRVESLSPRKNQNKRKIGRNVSMLSQGEVPEIILLDDDDNDGNINSTSIANICSTNGLISLELADPKTEPKDTVQMGCETNSKVLSCEKNNGIKDDVGQQPFSIDSCEEKRTEEPSHLSNPSDASKLGGPSNKRKRIKPLLVSNNQQSADTAIQQTYNDFKDACLAASNDADMKIILEKKLDKNYKSCSPSFKNSSSFRTILSNILEKVKTDQTNVYVHIAELVTELKARKASEEPPKKKVKPSSKDSGHVDYEALQSSRDKQKIIKLNKTLNKLQKMINKLEMTEVSWEDDEDSSYIMLQRYKQRAVKVFEKLCEYTKESPSAGKIKRIHLSNGTRFPEVNKCVEKFVNSTGEFPDFCDIFKLMKDKNDEENMKLQESEIEDMAREVFKEVGGELQRQRQHGVAESLYVFIQGEDPAGTNEELKAQLNENAKHWKEIDKVIDEYAEKAKEKKGSGDSKSEEEDEDEEEEEEDEEEEEEGKNLNDEDLEEIEVPDFLKGALKSDDEDESDSEVNNLETQDPSVDLK